MFARGYEEELVAPERVSFGWACAALVLVKAWKEVGGEGWKAIRGAALEVRERCEEAKEVWKLLEEEM